MSDDRTLALEAFGAYTGLTDMARLVQRGRDPDTARFTIEMTDGREIRVGTIDALMSRAKFNRVLAVVVGKVAAACKPTEWQDAVGALISHATDVEETPGETFEETVREWAISYADSRATSDRDGAAALGEPFRDDEHIYIAANGLAKYVRREFSEQVKIQELRQALADLSFERTKVSYDRGRGKRKTRTSASYYRAEHDVLGDKDAGQ